MKYLATSILSISDNLKENVSIIDKLNTDYLHIDIMDGLFVKNKTWDILEIKEIVDNHLKPLDVHLMVNDIKKYVDDFKVLKPEYITFHYEAVNDVREMIYYIKSKKIKAGISIKPNNDLEVLKPFLLDVDLILIMSVEPGMGGQSYLDSATTKINELKRLRDEKGYKYVIEVDGGINNETINNAINSDIFVVGSYITKNDYEERINIIKDIVK